MWPNPQFPADLVTFTEEILNGKLHFLCSVKYVLVLKTPYWKWAQRSKWSCRFCWWALFQRKVSLKDWWQKQFNVSVWVFFKHSLCRTWWSLLTICINGKKINHHERTVFNHCVTIIKMLLLFIVIWLFLKNFVWQHLFHNLFGVCWNLQFISTSILLLYYRPVECRIILQKNPHLCFALIFTSFCIISYYFNFHFLGVFYSFE